MVKKKLLTIDDLVAFCRLNDFTKFSAKESGYQLAVQVPTTFEVEDKSDDDHRGMLKLKFRILHDGLNRNGSFVSHSAADKAAKTIADRPILAAIHQLDDGSWDFESHEMEIIENENGENEINYIEKQVGSFSSEKPFWEHDDELNKDYLCAYGYIPEEYTKAADIIRTKGWTKNSCELSIEEMAFNAKDKYLELTSFYLSGSTLLGSKDDGTQIQEGMLGSRADIADFSKKNNSLFSDNQVIELLSALNEKLDNLNINEFSKEGGNQSVKKKFEEVTEAEVKETPSAEVFDGEENPEETDYYEEEGGGDNDDPPADDPTDPPADDPTDPPADDPTDPPADDPTDPPADDDDDDDDDSGDDDDDDEESGIPLGQKDDDDTAGSSKKKYSIEYTVEFDGAKKSFSTIRDQLVALTTLVNETYGEPDCCFYDCDADPDAKVVYMHDYWNDKHYRQSYSVKKDVYSLKGDRTEVFCVYLSADEQKALESMKANYSSIQDKLGQYESEPEKLEVLADKCYEQIAETEGFKKLSERDTYFSMSVDEVRAEADKQLLEYAKGHKVEFSAKDEKKPVNVVKFGNMSSKKTVSKGRYGGIFNK